MTCQNIGTLLERKNQLDLNYETIAQRMAAISGKPISKAAVGHWFSGESGITLENLCAFLQAMELKVVDLNEVCVPKDEHDAMETMAFKYMEMRKAAKRSI